MVQEAWFFSLEDWWIAISAGFLSVFCVEAVVRASFQGRLSLMQRVKLLEKPQHRLKRSSYSFCITGRMVQSAMQRQVHDHVVRFMIR